MSWEQLYNLLGIRDFIYFISSSQIQDMLFPVKLVFVTFAMFFLAGVVYFMVNSSWLQYKFLEDVTEFFSWQSYGLRQISKRWSGIKKRIDLGSETELKLALIEAEDFLKEVLEDVGFEEKDFEESVRKAGRLISPILDDIMKAHELRNFIVYDPDYKLNLEQAKKMLGVYESAINTIGIS
ncbi:MAG: hypothetical protein A2812_02120 [Candidatus Staskawiczbacteria bacterium RIFCSPHIGHO2_01_FULL_36_16]|uniref:DUF4129 domain-containing protein n=1 Tax=Candidatus Staskawiczbacteria bacterium RIFCSPHIGHO2_01_FULL_36_16 TaxID=1802200 RepID=A0A1G2HQ06_9BACT|nr:MAG: hypothetical protein A2812_02120 [Candidatus Staskawiczbacteria bacterium RIFCSPHIGHO2_01_FULL_36_16]